MPPTPLLGPIQMDALQRLHDAENGLSVEELRGLWRYKQGAERSMSTLQRLCLIRLREGRAYFVRFPTELESKTSKEYSPEQLAEFDDITRRNLVYLYQDELKEYQEGAVPVEAIPTGVRRSLQHLGVLKWKLLKLTDLGRRLLGEILTKSAPPMQVGIGF